MTTKLVEIDAKLVELGFNVKDEFDTRNSVGWKTAQKRYVDDAGRLVLTTVSVRTDPEIRP